MISHYSTIVPFAAAIYVTLSFDNVLFRSLWSLDYAKLINDRISKLSLTTSSKIEEELKHNISINAAIIEKKSRLRGFSTLVFTIVTMWIMGFEQGFVNNTQTLQNGLYSFYTLYALLSVVGFIISCIYIERLLYQFILSMSVLLISFLSIFFDLHFFMDYGCMPWIVENISEISSILILIPLLLQLVTTWLYSENYYYMLSGTIKKEYDLYNKALGAKSSEQLPDEYKKAISQCWFDKEQGVTNDTKITNLSKTLKDRLENAIKIPSFLTIIKYATINIFKIRKDELALIEKVNIKGEVITQSVEERRPQTKITPSKLRSSKQRFNELKKQQKARWDSKNNI